MPVECLIGGRQNQSDHAKEKGVTIRSVIDSLGRNQDKKFIDEGNLYRLISRSKLPQAEQTDRNKSRIQRSDTRQS